MQKKSLQLDILHEGAAGVMSAGGSSLSLLILIEVFTKPKGIDSDNFEAIIFSSTFMGMFGSLIYESLAGRFGFKRANLAAAPLLLGTLCFFLSAFSTTAFAFATLSSIAYFSLPLRMPVQTAMLQRNFPKNKIGSLHSLALLTSQAVTILFSYLAGLWLEADLTSWRYIMILMSLASLLAFWSIRSMPSTRPIKTPRKNPFQALSLIWKDPLFGYVLLAWFIFGFSNLWIFPMRISYLSEHVGLGPAMITLVAAVIPETSRFLFLPMWAKIFDHWNFIVVRMLLNTFLGAGLYLFFTQPTVLGIAIGSIIFGLGFSGGQLAWRLWVTKMAPLNKVAEYMAVHVSLTGLRGSVGPFIGYALLSYLNAKSPGTIAENYQTMALISTGGFALSVVMLAPVIKYGRR